MKSPSSSSQNFLINLRFIPSGPGARSPSHSQTALFISFKVKGLSKASASTFDTLDKNGHCNTGLETNGSSNFSAKNEKAWSFTKGGLVTHTPSICKPWILLFVVFAFITP
ncbi:hypothetical protein HanPSC8_Chr03g0126671 [Helianthus annuus]|nr:hypothetical protein HanPSC8_Chr03g0126671 [Helianthus annuus]